MNETAPAELELPSDAAPPRAGKPWPVLATCAALLLAFGVTAWAAVRTKSATYDEPMHAMGAFVLSQYGDYRVNPEDPPLWQWWASLPMRRHDLKLDLQDQHFQMTLTYQVARWRWLFDALYLTPGNDADAFIMKARTMLLLLGVGLGAVIAWWSWRLAGGVAAVSAAVLYCLDPNFLAHAPLVKNDVAIALVGTALAFATWCAGRRLGIASAAAVALLGAAALVTKFSGPLLLVALAATLFARALLPAPWRCGRRDVSSFPAKVGLAAGLFLVTALTGVLAIWACYSFRFAPDPAGRPWDFDMGVRDAAVHEIVAGHPDRGTVTQSELDERHAHPAPLVRALIFCNDHRLLPQTWLYGMLYVYTSSRYRASFLWGDYSVMGFRSYFPLAFLFKTPLATLISFGLALIVGLSAVWRWRARRSVEVAPHSRRRPGTAWSAACLALPVLIVGCADLTARLNIGLRHILPLYPFFFIATGCAAARAWRQWGRNGRVVFFGLAAALLIETAAAFPDYIPFFNRAAGGERGGLKLLGDSNLDWGQDLPLLAKWQREHPDRKLYLLYFGVADPAYYGLRFEPLPGYSSLRTDVPPVSDLPRTPGVIAISASNLQGMYFPENLRRLYSPLLNQAPLDVLGGSIYLYEYNPGP